MVVQEAGTPYSYIVQTHDGRNYRRNRKHLRKSTTQATDLTFDTADDFEIPTEPSTSSEPNEPGTPSPPLPPPDCQTKRGRTIRIVGGSWTIVLVNPHCQLQCFCIQVNPSMDQSLLA